MKVLQPDPNFNYSYKTKAKVHFTPICFLFNVDIFVTGYILFEISVTMQINVHAFTTYC